VRGVRPLSARARRLPAALLLAALALGACDGAAPDPPDRMEDRWLAAVDGLCGALTSAQEPEASQQAFYDRSHMTLHEIAAELQSADRAAAAALLEAKDRVEGDYRTGAAPSKLEADLTRLIGATVEGLRALDVESPGCA
jgi:hypothetical protein